jgi:hypothetical protein
MKAIDLLIFKNPQEINGKTNEEIINSHCPLAFFKNTIELCDNKHANCEECWDQEVNVEDYFEELNLE